MSLQFLILRLKVNMNYELNFVYFCIFNVFYYFKNTF